MTCRLRWARWLNSPVTRRVWPASTSMLLVTFLICLGCSGGQSPALAEDIPLRKTGGVYTLPVEMNGVLTLPFILDTGAADVQIPADVALTLIRMGTVRDADFLPGQFYTLADGTTVKSPRFMLRSLKIGTRLLTAVPASIGDLFGAVLLGQNVLERLGPWTMDTPRSMLVLGPAPRRDAPGLPSRVARAPVGEPAGHQELQGYHYVRQMITDALIDGGMGKEGALLATKRRLKAFKPPKLADAHARKQARLENARGLQYTNLGQIAEAAQAFQAAYHYDPTDAEIVTNLGDMYQRLHQLAAAEPVLIRAVVLAPDNANAWVNLGATYAKQGRHREAVACFANGYRFSRHPERTRQFLQRWAEGEMVAVREAAYQTLLLPWVSMGQ